MLAAQLLDGGEYGASYALEAVAERYLDEAVDKSEQRADWSGELSRAQLEYAARDAAILLPLRERLAERLEDEGLGYISGVEFRAVAAISEMELAGVKLDVARWKELEKTVTDKAAVIQLVKDAFAYCDDLFAKLTNQNALEIITGGVPPNQRQLARANQLTMLVVHGNEHYGNLVTYMRIKGIVPPSSSSQ